RGRLARRKLLLIIDIIFYFHTKIKNNNDPDYVFTKIWRFISNSSIVDRLFPKINRWILKNYQLQKNEYLIFELVERMKKRGMDYVPKIYPEDMALWGREFTPEEGSIIVSVHTGFAFNLRILSDM